MNHSDYKGYKTTQNQAHLQTAQGKNTRQSLQKSLSCQLTKTNVSTPKKQTFKSREFHLISKAMKKSRFT
jgi:hypothetical protein